MPSRFFGISLYQFLFPVGNKGHKQTDRVKKSRFVASLKKKKIPAILKTTPEMNSDGNCSQKNSRGVPPPICTHDYAAMLCIYLYRLHHRWLDNSLGCHLIRSRFESVQDRAQWMTHGLNRLFSLLCLPDCGFEFEEVLWLYTAGNSVSSARSALSHARVLQT